MLQGFALDLYEVPYGLLLQELQSDSGILAHAPDITLCLSHTNYLNQISKIGGKHYAKVELP